MWQISTTNSREDKIRRRAILDHYAEIAQLSALVPILVILTYRLVKVALGSSRRGSSPSSPFLKASGAKGSLTKTVDGRLKSFLWWCGNSVYLLGWPLGTNGEIVAGVVWTLWLLLLSAAGTNDYIHITKQFGIVGASQLPLHYMLAWKTPWNPIALATGSSWEVLVRIHQALGRAITLLFALHGALYLNYFIQVGVLAKRIQEKDVILGLIAIGAFFLLGGTALDIVRNKNYRLFFIIHVAIAVTVFPVLWFHVHHIRVYITESIIVYGIGAALRQISKTPATATVTQLGSTGLLEIHVPKSDFKSYSPGQHVYISRSESFLPPNPFTISSLPTDDTIHLLLRIHTGNTQTLAAKTKVHETISLHLEGPYGHKHVPRLQTCDRIVLIAGGVGLTFLLPLHRALRAAGRNTELHWAVRSADETRWATRHLVGATVHITGTTKDDDQGVEMQGLLPTTAAGLDDSVVKHGRPDLHAIVSEAFRSDGRVAVYVCGPAGMGDAVRHEVGNFVSKGREVVFWNEEFGLS